MDDMSNRSYHASPEISASWLKLLLAKTPRHVWRKYIDPDRVTLDTAAKKALKIGRLTHTMALEPHKFDEDFIVVDNDINRKSKDGKAFLDELDRGEKCWVYQKAVEEVKPIVAAICSDPDFVSMRKHAHVNEKSFFWDDDETGLACKFRPDTLVFPCEEYPLGAVLDVKTSRDASPVWFGRFFFSMGYHIQAAHYAIGAMHAFGTDEPPLVVFEVVETEDPFLTKCYKVEADVLEYGFSERARLMNIAKQCFDSGQWPGYEGGMIVPPWIRREMEESGEIDVSYVEESENE